MSARPMAETKADPMRMSFRLGFWMAATLYAPAHLRRFVRARERAAWLVAGKRCAKLAPDPE